MGVIHRQGKTKPVLSGRVPTSSRTCVSIISIAIEQNTAYQHGIGTVYRQRKVQPHVWPDLCALPNGLPPSGNDTIA